MARLARTASGVRSAYDAIVVGSGYGGGVAASRLARAGLKVAVLERGREILPGEFPTGLLAAQRDTQITVAGKRIGSASALFDIRVGRDVHVLQGCGVGGTSLINANVCLNPTPVVLDDPRWPQQIRFDHFLNIGFHRARAMLAPETLPPDKSPLKLKALEKAAAALGRRVERVPLHIAFEETFNAAGVHQPACTLCGDCMGGCNVGAKTTVHCTYLADAVRHGAEVFEDAAVRFIEKTADKAWRVVFRTSAVSNRTVPRRGVIAPLVVLAAGTLGSNEILMRSRERGLALSSRLGERVSTNADAIALGYNNDVPVNAIGIGNTHKPKVPPPGPGVTGLIDLRHRRAPEQRLAIVEASVQSALAAMLPLALPASAATAPSEDFTAALRNLTRNLAATGESLFRGAYSGATHHTQIFLAVGHDSGTGRITLDGDNLAIDWPDALKEPVFAAIEETLKQLVTATRGTYVPNPATNKLLGGNLFTVHPLGGCIMGEDRDGGVVDHKCRVFDASPGCAKDAVHDGLYVCDASVIPCALGVHPLLTITAVAERAMLLLARDLGRSLDVEPVVGRGRAVPMPAVETSQATIDGVASSAPATATSNA